MKLLFFSSCLAKRTKIPKLWVTTKTLSLSFPTINLIRGLRCFLTFLIIYLRVKPSKLSRKLKCLIKSNSKNLLILTQKVRKVKDLNKFQSTLQISSIQMQDSLDQMVICLKIMKVLLLATPFRQ